MTIVAIAFASFVVFGVFSVGIILISEQFSAFKYRRKLRRIIAAEKAVDETRKAEAAKKEAARAAAGNPSGQWLYDHYDQYVQEWAACGSFDGHSAVWFTNRTALAEKEADRFVYIRILADKYNRQSKEREYALQLLLFLNR